MSEPVNWHSIKEQRQAARELLEQKWPKPLFRVLVCGGRNYNDQAAVFEYLDRIFPRPDVIIHGAAKGADSLADQWARSRGVPIEPYPADWTKYGRKAGPRRNAQMLRVGKPTHVIAFPGSWGTADMVKQARDAGFIPIAMPPFIRGPSIHLRNPEQ